MDAAGVAGALEPQAPCRVAAEHVAIEDTAMHQLAVARHRALLVEGAAGETLGDVRALLHRQERRKHLLAGGIEQE